MNDKAKSWGRILGPLAALIAAFIGKGDLDVLLLGITAWMLIWWVTETVDLAVTALLPMLLFPLLLGDPLAEVAAKYAHPLVYLFFGGFVLALGIEKAGLHRRIALWILMKSGTKPASVLMGFMLATAFLSMWISNTATSIMMLPIATSVLGALDKEDAQQLSRPLLLAVAWSANIGGMATLIGTPPNLILAGFMESQLGASIGFVDWLPYGLTATITIGTIAYFLLTRGLPKQFAKDGASAHIQQAWQELGSTTPTQRAVAFVFATTAVLWILRPYLVKWTGWTGLTDTSIALGCAVALFAIRSGGKELLVWKDTTKLPWGILLLFGGGLALAARLQGSYWFESLEVLLVGLGNIDLLFWLLVMALLGVFATEMLSNMALVSSALPLLIPVMAVSGTTFEQLALPLVLGASCAFMLPMATPPNAVVFSTGKLTVGYMMKRGLVMNVIAVVLLVLISYVIV